MRWSLTLATILVLGVAAWLWPAGSRKPNIVFVLVDDMGWTDSSLYGSTYYKTPNLDRLAERGMRFDRAYAASPICLPSRAAILTGKYPARLKMTPLEGARPDGPLLARTRPWKRVIPPLIRKQLPLEEYTIAEALRDAGYRTGFIGKWHLGSVGYLPEHHGFDVNIGGSIDGAPPSYHAPYGIPTVPDGPDGEYLTDRLTDEALTFIEANRDRPFFLSLWHYAVHSPWGHKREITAQWRERRDATGRHGNPVTASMLQSVDEGLGRILEKLDELGIADETVVIFTSDNGGTSVGLGPANRTPTSNRPLRSGKASLYEGGIRVPFVVAWPGVAGPGSTSDARISLLDLYPTLLQAAGVSPRPGQILDGQSLLPALAGTGHPQTERGALFWHWPHYGRYTRLPPSTAVRSGPWKLMRLYGAAPDGGHAHRLYNLDTDPSERSDLADRMPDKVAALDELISDHLTATRAELPRPNPAYNPRAEQPWRTGAGH